MSVTGLRSYLTSVLSLPPGAQAGRVVNLGLAGVLAAEGVSMAQWRNLRARSAYDKRAEFFGSDDITWSPDQTVVKIRPLGTPTKRIACEDAVDRWGGRNNWSSANQPAVACL